MLPWPLHPLSALSVWILGFATVLFAAGWSLDVATTLRGLRRAGGDLRLEQNPLARVVFARLGVPLGFAALGASEVGLVALHWGLAAHPWPFEHHEAITALVALGPLTAGAGHALAARANLGRGLAPCLRPVLRLYRALDASRHRG
jgi:hypothetical protein